MNNIKSLGYKKFPKDKKSLANNGFFSLKEIVGPNLQKGPY